MEAHEIWDPIGPGGDAYKKGGAEDKRDPQATSVSYAVSPREAARDGARKDTASGAWEVIKELHQGHSRVREARLQSLLRDYESLKMDESESVDKFAMRVVEITSSIKDIGETLTDTVIVPSLAASSVLRHHDTCRLSPQSNSVWS